MPSLDSRLEAVERKAAYFFTRVLPAYGLVRVFLGLVYFWFGILKFNFMHAPSPAEDLIRTVWGPYLNADTFITGLAIFEATAGLLLLLDIRTRLVSILLVFHVLGTFSTVVLDPGSAVRLNIGFYALNFVGQYIFKNVLILSSCIFLLHRGSRAHARRDFRVAGTLRHSGEKHPVFLQDISSGGLCFLVATDSWQGQNRFILEFLSPLDGKTYSLQCRTAWARKGAGPDAGWVVGSVFESPMESGELVRLYTQPLGFPLAGKREETKLAA